MIVDNWSVHSDPKTIRSGRMQPEEPQHTDRLIWQIKSQTILARVRPG